MRFFLGALAASMVALVGCGSDSSPPESERVTTPTPTPERARVSAVLSAAVEDAVFVLSETRGATAPFDRAFGATAPFGHPQNRGIATLEASCVEPVTFDEDCHAPPAAHAEETMRLCRQLSCEEGGVLKARAWSLGGRLGEKDLLPGESLVQGLDHVTRFRPEGDTLRVTWRTGYRVVTPVAPMLSVVVEGNARIAAVEGGSPSIVITLAEGEAAPVVVALRFSATGVFGEGTQAGRLVLRVTPEGVKWS